LPLPGGAPLQADGLRIQELVGVPVPPAATPVAAQEVRPADAAAAGDLRESGSACRGAAQEGEDEEVQGKME
jgi:hypothetical protein